MPEAACGGPLATVRDGERVHIDVLARRLDLEVNDLELESRLKAWQPVNRNLKPGWLAIYSELVQPIQTGAVLGRRRRGAAMRSSG